MKKLLAIGVCALVLAACGGNGGTYQPEWHGNTPDMKGMSQPKLPNSQPPVADQGAAEGAQFLALGGKGNVEFTDADNIKKLTLNGKEFDLSDVNMGNKAQEIWQFSNTGLFKTANGIPPKGLDTLIILDKGVYDYMNVGIVKADESDARFAFFNGKFTDVAALPKSATYAVSTFLFTPGKVSIAGSTRYDLTADFSAKKLTGQLDKWNLEADIEGNRFQSADKAPLTVKGGFFGEGAKGIGGTFRFDEENTIGVFAGEQKK